MSDIAQKKHKNVIVVNDDPDQLNILSYYLKSEGIEAITYKSAEIALKSMAGAKLPDLIITDLNMPGIDGWRFCRLLRSADYSAYNKIPLMVVSATFCGEHPAKISTETGADDFMSAPVNKKVFMTRVKALLQDSKDINLPRVLIVEDDLSLALLIGNVFSENGYEVHKVHTYQDAEYSLGRNDYNLALIDYYLPDSTGDNLLELIAEKQPDCICVMMTSDRSPDLAFELMKRGAAAFLQKPFNAEYLIETCARVRRERSLLRSMDLLDARTAELKESQSLLSRSESIAQTGSWKFTLKSRTLIWSDGMYRVFGCTRDEFENTYKSYIEFVHPEDRDLVNHVHNSIAVEGGGDFSIEYRIIRKDNGEVRHVRGRGEAERDINNNFISVRGMVQDITDHKRMENQIRIERDLAVAATNSDTLEAFLEKCLDAAFQVSNMDAGGIYLVNPENGVLDLVCHRGVSDGFAAETGHIDSDSPQAVIIGKGKPVYSPYSRLGLKENDYNSDGPLKFAAIIPFFQKEELIGCLNMASRILEDLPEHTRSALEKLAITAGSVMALERAQKALVRSEEKYRLLLEGLPDIVARFDIEGRHLFISENVKKKVNIDPKDFIGRTHRELGFPEEHCKFREETIRRVFESGETHETEFILEGRRRKGVYNWRLVPEKDVMGQTCSVLTICRNITTQRKAEQDYKNLFNKMLDGFALHEMIFDGNDKPVDYRFLSVNPSFEKMTGLKAEEIMGRSVREVMPDIDESWIEIYGKVAMTGEPVFFENYSTPLEKHFNVSAFCPAPGSFACIFNDISYRKKAEAEREKLHAQLARAQRMESVGRLAGGVAHDFNNMLSVIRIYSEMALNKLNRDDPMYERMEMIRHATERSAELTRQLLAFASKEVVSPRTIDFNDTVSGMLKIIQKLIGENIDLLWKPGFGIWPVRMDPSQLDQILANLCVNARDAISDVGRIEIQSQNIVLDEAMCSSETGFIPGDYVLLTVADNGCGMDQKTLDNLFEPFFTTKDFGKGTGLGLATVYGAVRQNRGFIKVNSEPSGGSVFSIYIPRHQGKAEDDAEVLIDKKPSDVKIEETILLVEDEPMILSMTESLLKELGYYVIGVDNPVEAISLAEDYDEKIDLLITDVIMPDMNGRDLERAIQKLHPGIACLYMSGYTADTIAPHGVLDEGVHFMQKPFSVDDLSSKLREIIRKGK